MPPAPKLYRQSAIRTERMPLFVFGFPITFDDRSEWADRLDIHPEEPEVVRTQLAWERICAMLPPAARRATLVHYNEGAHTCAMCIYIGSNKSRKDLVMAHNEDLLFKVWDILQINTKPRWLKRMT